LVRAEALPRSTQVVVAGGGPVGLGTAIELGQRGISCLVIEPRQTVAQTRPRCKTINVRSMAHLRRWGIADRLRARAPLSTAWSQDVVFCTSLAGRELSRFTGVFGLTAQGDRFPELGQQAPQYVLEELLREVVEELTPCRLVTGSRVVGVQQDDAGALVTVQDQAGRRSVIAAEYVIGCDGPRSVVREQIGSQYVGDLALRPNFGMMFRAPDLWQRVKHGPAVQYWVVNRGAPSLIGPVDLQGMWWIITIGIDRETGERDGQQLIQSAVGAAVRAEILSTDPWTARMELVDQLRHGRVFLAGDAAHLNPPFGGHGLNTGVGDAVDLGWKLAAVLDGWGGPAMLDSYEAERRPVQTAVIEAAVANMSVLSGELVDNDLELSGPVGNRARERANARIQMTKTAEFHALDLVLGASFEDSPLTAAEAPSGRNAAGDSGRPGSLLPHAWLSPGHSVYDELGRELTLLVAGGEPSDAHAKFEQACRERRVPLTVVDVREAGLRDRYGANLVLVRPDQIVAWRGDGPPQDPGSMIDRVRGARNPEAREHSREGSIAATERRRNLCR
jgi:2-polyprenyl-6-methoxyphenol hydroxylase-like FAD-dependent oxidoreductase